MGERPAAPAISARVTVASMLAATCCSTRRRRQSGQRRPAASPRLRCGGDRRPGPGRTSGIGTPSIGGANRGVITANWPKETIDPRSTWTGSELCSIHHPSVVQLIAAPTGRRQRDTDNTRLLVVGPGPFRTAAGFSCSKGMLRLDMHARPLYAGRLWQRIRLLRSYDGLIAAAMPGPCRTHSCDDLVAKARAGPPCAGRRRCSRSALGQRMACPGSRPRQRQVPGRAPAHRGTP